MEREGGQCRAPGKILPDVCMLSHVGWEKRGRGLRPGPEQNPTTGVWRRRKGRDLG